MSNGGNDDNEDFDKFFEEMRDKSKRISRVGQRSETEKQKSAQRKSSAAQTSSNIPTTSSSGSSTEPPERHGIKRKSEESELSSLTRQWAEDTERSRQMRKRFRSEQQRITGEIASSIPEDIEMSDTSTHLPIWSPDVQMSENLTVEEWERALELRTRIPDPGLTERPFWTQRSTFNVSATQGSATQAPDTHIIDRRYPYPRPINLDWNQSYGMRASFPMPVSTASQSQISSFGYPSIGSSYGSEDIDQEEEDTDQSLIDEMRDYIEDEKVLFTIDESADDSEVLADKFKYLRIELKPDKREKESLIENRLKWGNVRRRWFLPSGRIIEMPSDYQRRPLEPQELRIPSQFSEPHAFSLRKKQQTLSTYPGLTQHRLRYYKKNLFRSPKMGHKIEKKTSIQYLSNENWRKRFAKNERYNEQKIFSHGMRLGAGRKTK